LHTVHDGAPRVELPVWKHRVLCCKQNGTCTASWLDRFLSIDSIKSQCSSRAHTLYLDGGVAVDTERKADVRLFLVACAPPHHLRYAFTVALWIKGS